MPTPVSLRFPRVLRLKFAYFDFEREKGRDYILCSISNKDCCVFSVLSIGQIHNVASGRHTES